MGMSTKFRFLGPECRLRSLLDDLMGASHGGTSNSSKMLKTDDTILVSIDVSFYDEF